MSESNLLGPKGHVTWLSANIRLDGIAEIRWAMPNGEKRMTVQMVAGPTLLQRTWALLDAEVDAIKTGTVNVEWNKAKATAIAEVLAMFMVPHFSTTAEISAEALRRWQARQAGDTEYETAGLGSLRFTPPTASVMARPDDRRSAPAKTKTRAAKPAATGKRIPEQAIETAKQGIASKMFTVGQIASGYGMTEAEVIAQLGLDTPV